MTDFSAKLSAYLDNELSSADVLAVEARLRSDPAAQAELDALIAAEVAIGDQFDAMLTDPVPLALARRIGALPLPATTPAPAWSTLGLLAASLALLMVGGAAGYAVKGMVGPATVVAQRGWLADIADYHAVYASQTRHLAEVPATEADHIETWLAASVGTDFTIPDLADLGLTFQGGRLLVAGGKPVAQLTYTTADGTVIALCFQRAAATAAPSQGFATRTINDLDMVTWTADGTSYVVIGPQQQPDLDAIATAAAAVI
jgi:anti-sigma factor RsiW